MQRIRRTPPLLILLAFAAGCSDANSLADPTISNVVDTVTIGALVGTPISTPSAYSVVNDAVRVDQTPDFEFAYNVQGPDSQRVFLPRAALGLVSTTSANPGVQARSETFDQITEAQSNGYITDSAVAVSAGERFMVRSRVICTALGVPQYAKLEILTLDNKSVTFQVLVDRNCGYKGLEPGLPDN
jgi:hypothetical protein